MSVKLYIVLLPFIHLTFSHDAARIDEIQNAKPAHMELDPKFSHIFNTHYYQKLENDSRIGGGGWEAEPHSRPFQVAIYTPNFSGMGFCGGSLIGLRTVLTAAHCLMNSNGQASFVFLGAHNLSSDGLTLIRATNFLLHPDWNPLTVHNDVALLYLDNPASLDDRIQLISLSHNITNNYLGQIASVSGWGLPGDGHTEQSSVLREVSNRIIGNVACRMAYMGIVIRSHICMSGENRRSTCRGDSGGPLVVDGKQVGVVSFGTSAGCEVGWPPVFARVTSYNNWINENIEPTSE